MLRIFTARRLTITAVIHSIRARPCSFPNICYRMKIPSFLHRSAETELEFMHHYGQVGLEAHRTLLEAMLVAPDDLVGRARLTSQGGGVYTWDVAPLLALLTDSDMELLLGDRVAVAAWCHQQLCQAPEERPEGLTAELDTPRGRADLLLNPDLLLQACLETGSDPVWKKDLERWHVYDQKCWWHPTYLQQIREELEDDLRCDMEGRLTRSPNLDGTLITIAARNWKMAIRRLLSGEELRTEYDALVRTLPDRWHLRQYAFDDNR